MDLLPKYGQKDVEIGVKPKHKNKLILGAQIIKGMKQYKAYKLKENSFIFARCADAVLNIRQVCYLPVVRPYIFLTPQIASVLHIAQIVFVLCIIYMYIYTEIRNNVLIMFYLSRLQGRRKNLVPVLFSFQTSSP